MNLYIVEHEWRGVDTPDSVLLGVYTTHKAAWRAMRNTAIRMGSEDAPTTLQPWLRVPDSETLRLTEVELNQDEDDTTVPRRVYFSEWWARGRGHVRDGLPGLGRHDDDRLVLYRDLITARSVAAEMAESYLDHSGADPEQLVRHGPGSYGLINQPDGEVWSIRVITEPVKNEAYTVVV